MTNRKRKKSEKREIDSFTKIIDGFKIVLNELKQSDTPVLGRYYEIKFIEKEISTFNIMKGFALRQLNQRKKNYKPTGKVIKFNRWIRV